jgi:hypothetical protein
MTYLFDPTQFPEFGYEHFQGDGFSCRYQKSKKLFLKSAYVPFGPNCENERGLENFLSYMEDQKFNKIKIDLPIIYNKNLSNEIVDKLQRAGFRKTEYIQDEETLLVLPSDMQLDSSKMNKVRYGINRANIIITSSLSDKEIDQIYDVYLQAINRLGAKPKNKDIFKKMSNNCLASLAYDKDNGELLGYVFGYFTENDISDFVNKKDGKVMLVMFTGLTDKGRDYRLGHAIHYELFKKAFDDYSVDLIDFHGASRKKGRSYVDFKMTFGDRFFSLPGSFELTRFL